MAREEQAMTSERLAEIRARAGKAREWKVIHEGYAYGDETNTDVWYKPDVDALLDEVERLRAREAALVAVARAVAEANLICQNYFDDGMPFAPPHVDYLCPRDPVKASPLRAQARALLASAEQEGGGDGA